MNRFLRGLRKFFGLLFVTVGVLLGTVGLSITGAYTCMWYKGDPLTRGDHTGWLSFAGIGLGGCLLVWAGAAMLRAGETGAKRNQTFRLTYTAPQRRRSANSAAWGTFTWLLVGAEFLWISSDGPPLVKLQIALAGVVAVFLGFHAIFLCHELGHLAVAGLLGFDLQQMQIGTGPRLLKARLGGLQMEWRALLGGGFVRTSDDREQGWRWRHWLYVAGGPAAQGVFCLALAWWIERRRHGEWLFYQSSDPTMTVAVYVLFLAVLHLGYALVPKSVQVGTLRTHTDGHKLLHTPRYTAAMIQSTIILTFLHRVDMLWQEGRREEAWGRVHKILARYPSQGMLAVVEGHLLREQGDFAGAAASYARWLQKDAVPAPIRLRLASCRFVALARGGENEAARQCGADALREVPAEQRTALLDALATEVLAHELSAFLPDADAWSQEALTLAPTVVTLKGTRGSVLVELGRLEEGEALLQNVWKTSASETDAAICAYYLGVVAKRRGRGRQVRRWFRRSKSFAGYVGEWLTRRIASELKSASTM